MQITPFERRWLVTIFDAIYPGGATDALPAGAGDVGLERFVDDVFDHAPFQPALGIRLATWVILLCPLFVIGRARTFVGLSREDREQVLHKLGSSRVWALRELPALLKMVGALGYCALPAVQRQIGIPLLAADPSWARGEPTPGADLTRQDAIAHANAAAALAPASDDPRAPEPPAAASAATAPAAEGTA